MLPIILAVFITTMPERPPTLVQPFPTIEACARAREALAEELGGTPGAKEVGAEAVCLVPTVGRPA